MNLTIQQTGLQLLTPLEGGNKMDWDCCVYRTDIECHCYPDGCRTCIVNPYAVDDEEEED